MSGLQSTPPLSITPRVTPTSRVCKHLPKAAPTPAGSAHRRLRRTQLCKNSPAAFGWVFWGELGVLSVCLFVFQSRALLGHAGVRFRGTLRRRPLPPGGPAEQPPGPSAPPAYLSISALQSHHEPRVVLVGFLGQLKGFLHLQQLLFGSHGRAAPAAPAPHGPASARQQRPRRPRAQLQTQRGSRPRSREEGGRARARARVLEAGRGPWRGGPWRAANGGRWLRAR